MKNLSIKTFGICISIIIVLITLIIFFTHEKNNKFSLKDITNIKLDISCSEKNLKTKKDKEKVIDFINSINYESIDINLNVIGAIDFIILEKKDGNYEVLVFYEDKINERVFENNKLINNRWYRSNHNNLEELRKLFNSIE